jgi:hypothetical protein
MPGAVDRPKANDPFAAWRDPNPIARASDALTGAFWPFSSPSFQAQLFNAPVEIGKAMLDPNYWMTTVPRAIAMTTQFWLLAARVGPGAAAQMLGMVPFSTPASLVP